MRRAPAQSVARPTARGPSAAPRGQIRLELGLRGQGGLVWPEEGGPPAPPNVVTCSRGGAPAPPRTSGRGSKEVRLRVASACGPERPPRPRHLGGDSRPPGPQKLGSHSQPPRGWAASTLRGGVGREGDSNLGLPGIASPRRGQHVLIPTAGPETGGLPPIGSGRAG